LIAILDEVRGVLKPEGSLWLNLRYLSWQIADQNEAKFELEVILAAIEQRITDRTRFDFNQPPPALHADPDE
jgi:hypothetical protein